MNGKGNSLVMVLISLSITSIVIMVMSTFLNETTKSLKRLGQKFESLDTKQALMRVLLDANTCSCQLNPDQTVDNSNDSNLLFDSNVTDGSLKIKLNRLQTGCNADSPILAKENELLPGTQTGLKIKSIELTDLKPSGSGSQWQGRWRISFEETSMATALRPIEVNQFFNVDKTVPTQAKVSSCLSPSSDGVTSVNPGIIEGEELTSGTCLLNYINMTRSVDISTFSEAKFLIIQGSKCDPLPSPGGNAPSPGPAEGVVQVLGASGTVLLSASLCSEQQFIPLPKGFHTLSFKKTTPTLPNGFITPVGTVPCQYSLVK